MITPRENPSISSTVLWLLDPLVDNGMEQVLPITSATNSRVLEPPGVDIPHQDHGLPDDKVHRSRSYTQFMRYKDHSLRKNPCWSQGSTIVAQSRHQTITKKSPAPNLGLWPHQPVPGVSKRRSSTVTPYLCELLHTTKRYMRIKQEPCTYCIIS